MDTPFIPAAAAPVAAAPRPARTGAAEDVAMLRASALLTRDLIAPRPLVYWGDLLASAVIGYGLFAVAVTASSVAVAIVAGILSVLALYRALLFIHEVSHIKHSTLPGFRLGWNLIAGIPLLTPSFMYEGVHNLHHVKTRYGTVADPEYLPLARMKPWSLPVFILISLLAPIGLLIRFAILSPLSWLIPPLRRVVIERYSSLSINPAFRRRLPDAEQRRLFTWLDAATSAWSLAVVAMVATGIIPLRGLLIALGIGSAVALLNQVRTLVAHLWDNEGEQMSVTAQYLDSVNVPPPGLLPALWAPVGLRYHALHHLLPSLPYHALGEAHRRIAAELGETSSYHKTNYGGALELMVRIGRSTMGRR
ncbi:fatty acid desaturase family protein [Sphingomonas abietis]|uniref:Fatty acid desaturase n=1 Tax=Sphingomonas abietis TaxID=3012344 RepID=A0ABY7NR32_9SPHN|nr:fatty acid desaturase [Sphingomonas abietis]WBO23995.1 fatty acid desaturase [Sphingomonas abietis]